jgi:hypothetical protein
MDPAKVTTMEEWPCPRTLRALQGFLGLMGYYHKFIMGYGEIVVPLTRLMKEAFRWSETTQDAFAQHKQALMTMPLLQMLDFSKRFIMDCDVSRSGFGAVLHQGDGLLPSSTGRWCNITRSYRHMNTSSLAWSKPSATGGLTCGEGH